MLLLAPYGRSAATIVLTKGRQRWVRTYTYIHTFYWINTHLRFFSDQYILRLQATINKYYKEKLFVEHKLLSIGIYCNAPNIKSKQDGSLFGLQRRLLTPKQEGKLIKVNENRANWSVKDFTRFGRIGFCLNPVLKAKHFRKHLLPYCYILHEDHISASLECPRREFKTGFKTAEVFSYVTSFQRLTTLILFLVNILHCRRTLPKLLRTETKLFVCDFLQNRLLKVKCNIKTSSFSGHYR